MSLQALGGRRLSARYICCVIYGQRVSVRSYSIPHLRSSAPRFALTKGSLADCHHLVLITATDAERRSDPLIITKDSAQGPASVGAAISWAALGAERGEGCAITIFAKRDHCIHDKGVHRQDPWSRN